MRIPDPDDAALTALHALAGDTSEVDRVTDAAAMDYAETVAALAEAVSSPPVLGLRGRLLAAAFAERTPGASIDDGGADTAAVAFARTAREVDHVLGELDDLDWTEHAHPTIGQVRDVVAHLLAIEHHVLAQLPDPPGSPGATGWARPLPPAGAVSGPAGAWAPEAITHVDWAAPVVAAAKDLPVAELRRQWRDAAEALAVAAKGAPTDATVELHGLRVGVESAMFLRTFELWAHLDDIARATGRRRPRLDARRLRALSAALVDVLPVALAVAGHADIHGRVDVVLTGPGGGTYGVALGASASGAVSCTLTVDVVDLCRLAARRATIAQIDVRVEGDAMIAEAVLASASAFAMD